MFHPWLLTSGRWVRLVISQPCPTVVPRFQRLPGVEVCLSLSPSEQALGAVPGSGPLRIHSTERLSFHSSAVWAPRAWVRLVILNAPGRAPMDSFPILWARRIAAFAAWLGFATVATLPAPASSSGSARCAAPSWPGTVAG